MANFDSDFMKGFALGKQLRPQVIAGLKEPVAYLYGPDKVRLPKLPEWDKETYPYAFIYLDGYTGYYWLWAFTERPYRLNHTGFLAYPDGAVAIRWVLYTNETEWGHKVENAQSGLFSASSLWANFDILNEDGTVYLAGSAPVPVYE